MHCSILSHYESFVNFDSLDMSDAGLPILTVLGLDPVGNGRKVKSVCGMDPMSWLVSVADSDVLSPVKNYKVGGWWLVHLAVRHYRTRSLK